MLKAWCLHLQFKFLRQFKFLLPHLSLIFYLYLTVSCRGKDCLRCRESACCPFICDTGHIKARVTPCSRPPSPAPWLLINLHSATSQTFPFFYPPFILTFQKLGILLQFYCSGSCKIQIKEKEVCFGGRVWVGYLISSKGDSRKTYSFYITRKLSLAHNFSKRVCLFNDKVNSLNAVVGSSFPLYGIDFFSFSCSESTGLLKI